MFFFIVGCVNVAMCLANVHLSYHRGSRLFWASWGCCCSALAVLSLVAK